MLAVHSWHYHVFRFTFQVRRLVSASFQALPCDRISFNHWPFINKYGQCYSCCFISGSDPNGSEQMTPIWYSQVLRMYVSSLIAALRHSSYPQLGFEKCVWPGCSSISSIFRCRFHSAFLYRLLSSQLGFENVCVWPSCFHGHPFRFVCVNVSSELCWYFDRCLDS